MLLTDPVPKPRGRMGGDKGMADWREWVMEDLHDLFSFWKKKKKRIVG